MNQEVKAPTKDEIIIRQSQLQRSVEIFQLTGRKPSVREICRLSKLLSNFIWTWNEDAEELRKFDKWTGNELKEDLINKLTPIK
jgi:hypothetical protein